MRVHQSIFGKNHILRLLYLIFLICLLLLSGNAIASDPVTLFVSVPPQQYLVERIGGEFVDVEVMIGPGQSPATYEPSPSKMAAFQSAQFYFKTGLPFETQILASLDSSEDEPKIVDLRIGIQLRQLAHHHGDHSHAAGASDPHIWLSPQLLKRQAETIHATLCGTLPEHSELFRTNLSLLTLELDSLDTIIRSLLHEYRDGKIYMFHPTLGYFCDAYSLEQVAVEVEGKEPSPRQLVGLIDRFREDEASTLFVQPQFSSRSIDAIAEAIGARVEHIDPLKYNVIENLGDMSRSIAISLQREVLEFKPE